MAGIIVVILTRYVIWYTDRFMYSRLKLNIILKNDVVTIKNKIDLNLLYFKCIIFT